MPAQRRLGHVTDQESMLRPHGSEALGGAVARDLVQRQRPSGLSWLSSGSAGQDPAATHQGRLSHHGIKGGYTLARDPHQISVLDVIKAREETPRDSVHGKHGPDLESVPGYHQQVTQIVEDALRQLTIADIKEQASSPTDSHDARRC